MFWLSSSIQKQEVIPVFRVVQYRASTQANGREKNGMTVLEVVYDERRSALIGAFFMLPLLVCLYCCLLLRRRRLFFRAW